MSIKLTDIQLAMMRAAAERDDRCFAPLPTLKGGAAQNVAAKLIAASLATEIKAKGGTLVWRHDVKSGHALALKLTVAGLKIVALKKEPAAATERGGPASPEAVISSISSPDEAAGSKPAVDAAPHKGSKLAAVVGMLRRREGATIASLTAATGWLPHTTRAAISGLRKRRYSVIRERAEDGGSVYRISDGSAKEADAPSILPEAASGRRRREPVEETRAA